MFFYNRVLTNFYKYKRKLNSTARKLAQQQIRTTTTTAAKAASTKLPGLKVLFFGTDTFSLPSFKALHEYSCRNPSATLAAVTSFKSPANCVRLYAERYRVPIHRWPITTDICGQFDLGVVVSFGHLIPEQIIKAFPHGMINVHASLLPRWRGAAPIIYAILNGDRTTGVSIMKIEPQRFDIGDILAQQTLPIKDNIFMPELHAKLASMGARLLMKVIEDFPKSFANATQQDGAEATYAPKITASKTEVLWPVMSAMDIYRRYRALYGFKHLNAKFRGKSVQLLDVRLPAKDTTDVAELHRPGSFIYQRNKKCLLIRCAADTYIEVHQLRIEGKKLMSAMEFNNGFLQTLSANDLSFLNKVAANC